MLRLPLGIFGTRWTGPGAAARVVAVLGIAAAMLVFAADGPPVAEAATFTVNSAADNPDFAFGDSNCDSDPGVPVVCTLRAAIQETNALVGPDTIEFNISGPTLIQPGNGGFGPLPPVTDRVTINGYTQLGSAPNTLAVGNDAVINININGQFAGAAFGLQTFGPNAQLVLRGVLINQFSRAGLLLNGGANHVIVGTWIGTNAAGNAAIPNVGGIQIENGAQFVQIGGFAPADRNLISGNNGAGIFDAAGPALDPTIMNNYIGTSANGLADLGNTLEGVVINHGASKNVWVGVPGSGNVISGNNREGVALNQGTGHVVRGNIIGLDANGALPVGNSGVGILVRTNTTVIGDSPVGSGNVVSGNNGGGIVAVSGTGLRITANRIGTDALGNLPRPNGPSDGILVVGATGVIVGGTCVCAQNQISGNNGNGINLSSGGTAIIEGNHIGLRAGGGGPLPNGGAGIVVVSNGNRIGGTLAGAGNVISANNLQGILFSGAPTGNLVQGNYVGTDATGSFDMGNVRSGIFVTNTGNTIGGTTAGAGNVISGNDSFGIELAGTLGNNPIQGNRIGTNAAGTGGVGNSNTGIFGNAVQNYTIGGSTGTTPGGPCTGACNLISGNFNNGVTLINTTGAASGFVIQGNYIGTDVNGLIDLGNSGAGIGVVARQALIGGTSPNQRNVIAGNNQQGIGLQNCGANCLDHRVEGNYIGIGANGTTDVGNSLSGVEANTTASPGVTIGGTAAGARNVISGNNQPNIKLTGVRHTVQGNFIGTNASGSSTAGITNPINGVYIELGSVFNTIGGSLPGAGNVISGHIDFGVAINGGDDNSILGNFIGTDLTASALLGNRGGIQLVNGAERNIIGGINPGERNVIANSNGDDGITMTSVGTRQNPVRGNSIFKNFGLGIDLNQDGVSANDAGDGDGLANDTQNYPVSTIAMSSAFNSTIKASLNSAPLKPFTVDFYVTPTCDGVGFGEGQDYFGTANVVTDGAGNVSGTYTFPVPLTLGAAVTLTATDGTGNTSEFSACQIVVLDTDGDGLPDSTDNCDLIPNPGQEDFDLDTIGDICDPDDDNDSMPDAYEDANGCLIHFGDDAAADPDGDGLSNITEMGLGTDPCDADTDNDTMPDGYEDTNSCLDPLIDDTLQDPDFDGILTLQEFNIGTNPCSDDTDGDGMTDNFEVINGCLDPLVNDAAADGDLDGLTNFQEFTLGTNPCNPDSDGDGLMDGAEVNTHGTDPLDPDTDGDGMPDPYEVARLCLSATLNDAAADAEGDGLTNFQEFTLGTEPCDADSDDDLLPDGAEVNSFGTSPLNPDTDGDGMSDYYEVSNPCLDPLVNDANADDDGDGLTNIQEMMLGTNPCFADSDGDGLTDGDEVNVHGTDPLDPDTDGDTMPDGYEVANPCLFPLFADAAADADFDGLTNLQEFNLGTNPCNPDSDGDGLSDGDEVNTYGTNPLLGDTDGDTMPDPYEVTQPCLLATVDDAMGDPDGDGVPNLQEFNIGTNPCNPDTDGDGMSDYYEVVNGCLDPLVVDSGADPDGDALTNAQELTLGTNPCGPEIDYDNDGCSNQEELGPAHVVGGQRDPFYFWDFYDVNATKNVDLQDTLIVLLHFGHKYNGGAYVDGLDNVLDRAAPNLAMPWLSVEGNNGVDLVDALANLKSFGDGCAAPP